MRAESNARRFLYPLTAAIVLAYFLFFTWRSVHSYFDADDMMNLYLAWNKPLSQVLKANIFFWSDFYRPMGALFYRTIYSLRGFDPLPFRIVCLGIGAGNIALCFWFAKLISGSERVAALASLMFAFHPRLLEVWYRTSVIYDLLCFTFLYAGACLYIDARQRYGFPGWGRVAAILVCHVCALNTKEMAVSLPVILFAWEVLFNRGPWKRLWLVGCLAVMNLPYIWGKTHGASALMGNPYYAPKYTWSQFEGSWKVYLQYLFLRDSLRPDVAIAILITLLLIAVAARSRILSLAWVIIVFGMLPVSFIPYRGGYALYISWAGWVLYGAVVLVALQDALIENRLLTRAAGKTVRERRRLALACLVFVLAGWRFGKVSLHDQRVDPRRWLYDPAEQVRSMATQMRVLQPEFPRGAHILFVEDSFPKEEWTPYFIMKLACRDDSMIVDRVKMMNPPPRDWNGYQYVFAYENGTYRRLKP